MDRAFAKRRTLNSTQARTVAAWRFDDAQCLARTGLTRRMNGAVYLAGFAVECPLKARLLEKHPILGASDPATLTPVHQRLWNLVYRLHDLDALLNEVPDVVRQLQGSHALHGRRLDTILKDVCARWSIHLRYHSRRIDPEDAHQFLDHVKCLRGFL